MNKIVLRSLAAFLGVTVLSIVLPPIGYLAGIALLIFGTVSYLRRKMSNTSTGPAIQTTQTTSQPCPACGKSLSRNPKFCNYCGAKLETPAERDRTLIPEPIAKSTMSCSNCGRAISPNLKFCPHCGADQGNPSRADKCTNCGATLPLGKKFCTKCGTKLEF